MRTATNFQIHQNCMQRIVFACSVSMAIAFYHQIEDEIMIRLAHFFMVLTEFEKARKHDIYTY